MEKIINKRKINISTTLEGRYIHKKTMEQKTEKISAFVQVNAEKSDKNKGDRVNPFQLVVIKLPWYKRLMRSVMSYFGYYYN